MIFVSLIKLILPSLFFIFFINLFIKIINDLTKETNEVEVIFQAYILN